MTPDSPSSTPNTLKVRDPELFAEIQDFRVRFEEMLLDKLDNVLASPRYGGRGHFLPDGDVRAIAWVVRVLTSDSWTEHQLDQFDTSWRDAMRSDFFAEVFESIRFRIRNAVDAARNRLVETRGVGDITQGTLW
jgi:hypothetical protein